MATQINNTDGSSRMAFTGLKTTFTYINLSHLVKKLDVYNCLSLYMFKHSSIDKWLLIMLTIFFLT